MKKIGRTRSTLAAASFASFSKLSSRDSHPPINRHRSDLLLRVRQISEEEARGAFTPARQRYGTDENNGGQLDYTFCMVLNRTRWWDSPRHIEVKTLHAIVINQLAISGLECVQLKENKQMKNANVELIGIKATLPQLRKEAKMKIVENSLRRVVFQRSRARAGSKNKNKLHRRQKKRRKESNAKTQRTNSGDSTGDEGDNDDDNDDDSGAEAEFSPAERILLTQRIISRALEVLRVRQNDEEKYISTRVGIFECLRRSFGCGFSKRRKLVRDITKEDSDAAEITSVEDATLLNRQSLSLSGNGNYEDRIVLDVRLNLRLHLFIADTCMDIITYSLFDWPRLFLYIFFCFTRCLRCMIAE